MMRLKEEAPVLEQDSPKQTGRDCPEDSWDALFQWGQEQLEILGTAEAAASAEYLLEEASGLKRWESRLKSKERLKESQTQKYRLWIQERKNRKPAAYITGKAFFREEILEVGPECLVPRPETELLVEAVIQETGFESHGKFDFLDLGTGSGAIAISLLRHFKNAAAVLADISAEALKTAKRNAQRYALDGRFETVQSDFFSAFKNEARTRSWPVIVSNPPYLAAEDWRSVEPELLLEPRLALDGGWDGLAAYRVIAREAGFFLCPRGLIFLEVGQGQAPAVKALLEQQHFTNVKVLKDYSGIDRIITARKGSHG